METINKAAEPTAVGLGPYKATKLWNDVISAFRQGVPRGKHRRYMRTAEDCFVGSSAVDWLLDHVKKRKDFGPDVTRQQITQLLNKFYKAGIFEEIQVSRRGRIRSDFSDSNRLYRLLPSSPSKGTRTPLAVRSINTVAYPPNKSDKDEKPVKQEKHKLKDSACQKKGKKNLETKPGHLEVDSLPQCHLVGRFLTGSEISEVWKTAVLSRLKKVLGLDSLEDVLQDYRVNGGYVRHNCIFLNKSGIVTNIQLEDQLPHWVLSAMKCLARWPEKVEGDLPSYPGFEKDVFGVVTDYFMGLPEPLMTYELYDAIINVFVQACNHLPRHSSPFSHGARDRTQLGQSLWSETSLENIILNLTRKYCMAGSSTDLFSLADSRPELFHTADTYSECYSHSDLHSMANSQRNLADSHRDMAGSHRDLADSHRDLADSHRDLAGSHRDLQRMAQSHGDLLRMTRSQTGSVPAARSKSHTDLFGRRLRSLTAGQPGLCGLSRSFGNLHGGCSVTNLHAAASSQHLGLSSRANSQSAFGQLSEPSSFKDSKQFRSSPDLQVSRYETAFGPENQTVTRVYYCNGMSTDFHHSSVQAEDELPPVEAHFDVDTDASHSRHQSTHISFEQVSRTSNLTGPHSESSRNTVEQSRSFSQPQEKVSDVSSSSLHPTTLESFHTANEPEPRDNNPASPVWVTEGKPPPYRRSRAERCNTFAGSQFEIDQVMESRGLEEWEKQLSASTPYLPGLKLSTDSHVPGSLGTRPRHFVSRSAGATAGRPVKRCSSMYMNYPQSGLDEERVTKALQVVCLFLPPAARRKLHLLLKLMSKMAANPFLTFDPSQTTRSLVLGTFQHAVLRSPEETDLDAVLVFQLVSFLVDHHMDILAVPTDMKEAVEDRLRMLQKPQIVYSPRDPGTLRFSRPLSMQQYEASKVDHSHSALLELLDNIARDQNMADREKRRRLKQFQKTYPHIYRRRFPDGNSDPLQAELRPRIKPPLFVKPLLKLRSLRV